MSYEPGYENIASYAEGLNFIVSILNTSGYKVELIPLPRKRNMEMLDDGDIDFAFATTKSDAKISKNIRVTSLPYAHISQKVVYVKSNKMFTFDRLSKLRGVSSLNTPSLDRHVEKLGLNLLEVRTPSQAFEMLLHGRVDYLISAEVIIQDLIEKHPTIKEPIEIYPSVLVNEALYLGIHKKHSMKVPLIEKNLKLALVGELSSYPHLRRILNTKTKGE